MKIPYVFCIWALDFQDKSTQTVETTSENKKGFLAKDTAIVLTGLARFSATCAVNLLAKIYFRDLTSFIKKLLECTEA